MTFTEYIKEYGPMLSSKAAQFIVLSEGIAETTARKRIERLTPPIHKLKGLFSESQSLLYHKDHYNSPRYFEALEEAFEIAGKRNAAIINAVNYHEGLISVKELANYTFSPVVNMTGHLLYDSLIQKLKGIDVLQPFDELYHKLHPYLSSKGEIQFRRYKAIEFSKDLVLNNFNSWCRKLGFVSFRKGSLNSVVAGFQFGYTGPSYISGLVTYEKGQPKPGFVVADILMGRTASARDIDFFVQKVNIIKARTPSIRLLPVMIVDGIDVKALGILKKNGVMVALIKELFGEPYSELLKSLIKTVSNAGLILKRDPEKFLNLMIDLGKLVDGMTNNLRGDLFELAVGYYYAQDCRFLEVGKKIRIGEGVNRREIDVFAAYADKVVIVECKGYNYPVDQNFVLKYLNERVPLLKKWMEQGSFVQQNFIFEIWSTGGFTSEALTLLEKAKTNTKKYKVDYLGKEEILARAKKLKTSKFIDILKEYYFKDL